jgi:hypothetical protein
MWAIVFVKLWNDADLLKPGKIASQYTIPE